MKSSASTTLGMTSTVWQANWSRLLLDVKGASATWRVVLVLLYRTLIRLMKRVMGLQCQGLGGRWRHKLNLIQDPPR